MLKISLTCSVPPAIHAGTREKVIGQKFGSRDSILVPVAAGDITRALLNWDQDREVVLRELMPAVYRELHRIASALMFNERPSHTLQPTVLIHEAYLRLIRQDEVNWRDRAHFYGIAARI